MNIRRLGALAVASVAVLVAVALVGLRVAHRTPADSPGVVQRQVEGAVSSELKLDPQFRKRYASHQEFLDLFNQMPRFDQASFGPTVHAASWHSVKWVIEAVLEKTNGEQYVRLAYGPGPGVDQEYTARLVNGQYIGHYTVDWDTLYRDPRYRDSVLTTNLLPRTCRDVRGQRTSFAVVPARPMGPSVTREELSRATRGASALPGTAIACYQFAGLTLIDLSDATDGVMFRLQGQRLVPVSQGYIEYADSLGRFILMSRFVGYDQNGLPLNDYPEAFPQN